MSNEHSGDARLLLLREKLRRATGEKTSNMNDISDFSQAVIDAYVKPARQALPDISQSVQYVMCSALQGGHVFVTNQRSANRFLSSPERHSVLLSSTTGCFAVRQVLSILKNHDAADSGEHYSNEYAGREEGCCSPECRITYPSGRSISVALRPFCKDTVMFTPPHSKQNAVGENSGCADAHEAEVDRVLAAHLECIRVNERSVLQAFDSLFERMEAELTVDSAVEEEEATRCEASPVVISIPVYRSRVNAADDTSTRLAHVFPFTNALIRHAVTGTECEAVTAIIYLLEAWSSPCGSLEDAGDGCIPASVPGQSIFFERLRLGRALCSSALAGARDEDPDVARVLPSFSEGTGVSYRHSSIIVHCLKGVSRSVSAVMGYFIHEYSPLFELLSSYGANQERERREGRGENASFPLSYADFLEVIRRSRSVASPNVCFSMELFSLWRQIVQHNS